MDIFMKLTIITGSAEAAQEVIDLMVAEGYMDDDYSDEE
jgi:polyhydroxyalkanoate synthesis regulator phasin